MTEATVIGEEIEELEQALENCAAQWEQLKREQTSLDSRRRILEGRCAAIAKHIDRLQALRKETE